MDIRILWIDIKKYGPETDKMIINEKEFNTRIFGDPYRCSFL